MSHTRSLRIFDVLRSLPDVFSLQSSTNYDALISHSSSEVSSKAWARTAKQLNSAMKAIEDREPALSVMVESYKKIVEGQLHEADEQDQQFLIALERATRKLELAEREYERSVGRLRDVFREIEQAERSGLGARPSHEQLAEA